MSKSERIAELRAELAAVLAKKKAAKAAYDQKIQLMFRIHGPRTKESVLQFGEYLYPRK